MAAPVRTPPFEGSGPPVSDDYWFGMSLFAIYMAWVVAMVFAYFDVMARMG